VSTTTIVSDWHNFVINYFSSILISWNTQNSFCLLFQTKCIIYSYLYLLELYFVQKKTLKIRFLVNLVTYRSSQSFVISDQCLFRNQPYVTFLVQWKTWCIAIYDFCILSTREKCVSGPYRITEEYFVQCNVHIITTFQVQAVEC
jgi:hypothetical protein